MRQRYSRHGYLLAVLGVTLILGVADLFAQVLDPGVYSELRYRHVGPEGNRVIAIAGHPGNRNIIYAGAASGGIWKTIGPV